MGGLESIVHANICVSAENYCCLCVWGGGVPVRVRCAWQAVEGGGMSAHGAGAGRACPSKMLRVIW
jgi:hypothetical protein